MKLTTLTMVFISLLSAGALHAEEAANQTDSNLCGSYRTSRLSEADAKLYHSWVKGYIIGHNQKVAPQQRVAQPDEVAFHRYISKFCEANPSKEVTAAVVCLSASTVNPKQKDCNIQQL